MTQDRYHTFVNALRTVLVAAVMLLTGSSVMAQVQVHGSVFGGGNNADVKGNTTVDMSYGIVDKNVYGGGNVGDVGTINKVFTNHNYVYTWTTNADTDTSDDTGICTVSISGGTVGPTTPTAENPGNVFGGGKGEESSYWCEKGMVYRTIVTISNGTVNGTVYGGGEIGHVEENTTVNIGTLAESNAPIIKGNVFGAGKGLKTHGYSALVRGNPTVIIQGKAQVRQNVYGGGEIASVARYQVALTEEDAAAHNVPVGTPYALANNTSGNCTVTIQGNAIIGPEGTQAATDDAGNVYGAGKGIEPSFVTTGTDEEKSRRRNKNDNDESIWEYFTSESTYLQFVETLALSSKTDVTIGGSANVKGSVYGGSQSGFVQYDTDVNISGGQIGINVFGGGKGLASYSEAGRVRGNTEIDISSGSVGNNVYGGGELGDVGMITKDFTTYNYTWKDSNGSANRSGNNKITGTNNNTGICKVLITGGTIGPANNSNPKKGNVFGAGKGKEDTYWCEKAMVYSTNVSISAGTVNGTVYGGGEIGRVEDDAKVTIGAPSGTDDLAITGNVFGAGAGIATHGYSALVRGNSDVIVQGKANVSGSVYGGGEVASVGRFNVVGGLPKKPKSGGTCTVTVNDQAVVTGSVYGACKGVTPNHVASGDGISKCIQTEDNKVAPYADFYDENGNIDERFVWNYLETLPKYLSFLETLALTSNTNVTIGGTASVGGSVYGGGERGITLGGVEVDITGGTVTTDVYGGGSLANTNTANREGDALVSTYPYHEETEIKRPLYILKDVASGESVDGLYTKDGSTYNAASGTAVAETEYYEKVPGASVTGLYTKSGDNYTQITSTSATADETTQYYAFYKTTVNLTGGAIGGDVYGGGLGHDDEDNTKDVEAMVYGEVKVHVNGSAISGSVFGCNNENGTPKGNVLVQVDQTVARTGQGENDFDLPAVYGGGNMAAYNPVTPHEVTDEETETSWTGSKTRVIVNGCQTVSIGTVYGGGNAAPVPEANVTINGARAIDYVYAGGHGVIGGAVANVGILDADAYAANHSNGTYGTGNATTNIYGGTINHIFAGADSNGDIIGTSTLSIEDKDENCYVNAGDVFSYGNHATMSGRSVLNLGCLHEYIGALYGGAMNADIEGDIVLNINYGKFRQVFGGNKESGCIKGKIQVNVEETDPDCPIIIDELFGCGNEAAYSVYGYDTDGSCKTELEEGGTAYDAPQINLYSFTTIGAVYGAGLGSPATVYGDPEINVNIIKESGYTLTDIYGGGKDADVSGDTNINIGITGAVHLPSQTVTATTAVKGAVISGDVFGGGLGSDTKVTGTATINIGEKKPGTTEGTFDYVPHGASFSNTSSIYGGSALGEVVTTQVNLYAAGTSDNNVINANVFGGGKGQLAQDAVGTVGQEGYKPAVPAQGATVGTANVSLYTPTVTGNIYGGCNDNGTTETAVVDLIGGSVGTSGVGDKVFGGGQGHATTTTNATVNVGTSTTVGSTNIYSNVYGGSALGAVGTAIVNLNNATTLTGHVFGGGMGSGTTEATAATVTTSATVNQNNITLASEKNIYGGCNVNGTAASTTVNLIGGSVTDVFGGGLGQYTSVTGNVLVNVGTYENSTISGNPVVTGDVYGGSAQGTVNKNETATTKTTSTTVHLYAGAIGGDVYGGGLGQKARAADAEQGITALDLIEAHVYGDVLVDLNNHGGTCTVAGGIFGCNNQAGSPKGHTTVHIYKTVKTQGSTASYDLAAVYGGGNEADYVPDDASEDAILSTEVVIEGCDDTSIQYVYGGGNAAAVPATEVWILGTKEIETIFGGGNGERGSDYAANVGFYSNGTAYANGTGKAETKLVAGKNITYVYGGSNSNGDVRGGSWISMPQKTEYSGYVESTDCCTELIAANIYGGGKNANMSGGTNIILGCQPYDWIKEIYAGSQEADVDGDVSLTITSGRFERVFGGNKTSGKLRGAITVNIEETGECETPIIIGELYAGGNLADYSIYGYNTEGAPMTAEELRAEITTNNPGATAAKIEELFQAAKKADPQLNVRAFTSIGAIYGGGLSAEMYANPTVSINVVKGSHSDDNALEAGTTGTLNLSYPAHASGAIGTIGNVFGGGNLATVYGSATVNIGTESTVTFITEPKHLGTEGTDYTKNSDNTFTATAEGANITGNVYGGGKLANITGNTQVNICAIYNSTTAKWESVSYAEGLAGVTIGVDGTTDDDHGNVFGGGKGEADNFFCDKAMVGIDGAGADSENYPDYADGNTTIIIGNGTVHGSVYGGGEVGRVEMNTSVTVGLGDGVDATTDTPTSVPEIKHSVFGGGKGVKTHGYSALVRGNPTVTIQGNAKVRDNVYGGGQIASVARYRVAASDAEGAPYGVKKDMPYALKDANSGFCTVTVQGYAEIGPATIASDAKTTDVGHVFGAGKGILPGGDYAFDQGNTKRMVSVKDESGHVTGSEWEIFANEAAYITFIKTLALSSQTNVNIDGSAKVKGSVFGGSESGFVQFDTNVNISGGTIGTEGKGAADFGNVYGGGKGDVEYTGADQNYVDAGIVKGNTKIKISETDNTDHPTLIYHNVYGGGAYGTVGEFVYDEYGIPTGRRTYTENGVVKTTTGGKAEVYITGGTIGTTGKENGMIFGSSRGDVGAPRSIHDKAAWVYDTHVAIGDTTTTATAETPLIKGSVYGGGENGHNLHSTFIRINGGTIGIHDTDNDVTYKDDQDHPNVETYKGKDYNYPYRGNVYGGGCGTDKYDNDTKYNPSAGIVKGDATIHITGGNIIHNVYGAGAMGSVGTLVKEGNNRTTLAANTGKTTINIGGCIIGVSGTGGNGNVYGAARGDKDDTNDDLALVQDTYVTIESGADIKGNVYGGGEAGDVLNNTSVSMTGGTVRHHVFGGGQGIANSFTCAKAMVGIVDQGVTGSGTAESPFVLQDGGTTVNISSGVVEGNVYGGGEVGRVERNTSVTIGSAIVQGSVFAAGAGVATHGYSALVRGTSTVTVQGSAQVWKNVYGGGELASVGRYYVAASDEEAQAHYVSIGMPYGLKAGGTSSVVIKGDAIIGTDNDNTTGHVYGAGQGIEPRVYDYVSESEYTGEDYNIDEHKPKRMIGGNTYVWFADRPAYLQFIETLAISAETDVTIEGGTIRGSVFGGSENGFVYRDTDVKVQGGFVKGDVFGGGRGLASYAEAGRVRGNTGLAISGSAVVDGNVYGGGNLGDVGTINKTDPSYNYIWKNSDSNGSNMDPDNNNSPNNNTITENNKNTGVCTVTISGGTIGTGVDISADGTFANGNVFGAGQGRSDTWWCEKAIAYATNVSISAGTVNGNVYGGGEVGRVEDDAKVTIGTTSGTNNLRIAGSVFGAGAGLATHGYSALVRGNSDVVVQGVAHIGGSVYGGGQIASVGRFKVIGGLPTKPQSGGNCTVKIQGNAQIGASVYGACKGVTPAYNNTLNDANRSKSMQLFANRPKDEQGNYKAEHDYWDYYETDHNYVWVYYPTEGDYLTFLKTLALTSNTDVTIDGSSEVNGSVYGGGERGITLGGVEVNMKGGTVYQDVYGGGSLADSNTAMWDATHNILHDYVELDLLVGLSHVTGYYTKSGDDYTLISTPNATAESGKTYYANYKTNVNLTGGRIIGDAYGGGLGQLGNSTLGVSAIEAMVYGDVKVELNNIKTANGDMDEDVKGCAVNRVFGCNNLNGTPKGKVQVYVYATQKVDGNNIADKADKNTNTYDVQAVYGGGNLAKYEPVDALLDYSVEENKEKVEAARPEVYIDGCGLTSIQQVYGGGNAAPAPATYVEVNRAYEIDEVFGGGNGFDNYSLKEGNSTVWYENPGANVGYYTYASYPKTGTNAGAGTSENPWKAVEIEKFSGGAEHKENRLSTTDPDAIAIRYGSGIATLLVKGGTIHTSYGGSNSKGNVRAKLASTYSAMFDDCPMAVGTSYGGGRNAYSDADAEVSADCAKGVTEMFGGSKNADFTGDVNMLITNGSSLERVFGGNNTSGAFNGNITITIKEGGCEPIRIGSLYAGGYLAPYSVYGYKKKTDGSGEYETEDAKDINGNYILDEDNNRIKEPIPLTAADVASDFVPKQDPRINIISATRIDNVFGGGYQAKLVGNPHININMEPGRILARYVVDTQENPFVGEHKDDQGNVIYVGDHREGENHDGDGILAIGTIGNVYGGGNMADIVGNTYVEIGTGKWVTSWDTNGNAVYEAISPARTAATITGNVYGGGNQADVTGNTYVTIADGTVESKVFGGGNLGAVGTYTTESDGTPQTWTTGTGFSNVTITGGTVGIENLTDEKPGNVFGGGQGEAIRVTPGETVPGAFKCAKGMVYETNVSISNGTVKGSVYGGGEVGRVENDTKVTIGLEGDNNSAPLIEGEVFGAGKGVNSHGYAALVRGNTYVTIQGNAKVKECVYGGGEIASVGRYNIADAAYHALHPKIDVGMPYSLANNGSGYCNVIVRDNAEIGPENMQMKKDGGPDDSGYVFGAGKGILPYEGTNNSDKKPGRVKPDDTWQDYFGAENEEAYLRFIETQGLATQTDVIITGNAFVKGSVYGGSFNGHVQHDTHVTIAGNCQIGQGEGITKRYTEHYGSWPTETENITTSWAECAHWDYDASSGAPYDLYATHLNPADGKYYYDAEFTKYAEGGAKIAKDGHTYYGNVFGGGSGSIPYAPGKWHREAGSVGGNTQVDITGGHILTSVYGGNEQTDVGTYMDTNNTIPESGGKCTINMTGGTVGVPRTVEDIKLHPVTCYVFGAGKGDQRIFFNTWTNVTETEVNISGTARIYGSTFGGGEDGHVLGNSETNIGGTVTTGIGDNTTTTQYSNVVIGTTGTSYVDGNVFGGGRGFSGDAQTAGTVGGNVEVNIENGTILGSVYGGGRLASVGTQFTNPNDDNYGQFKEDDTTGENPKTYGHVIVNISGGTIGRDFVKDEAGNLPEGAEHSGNVFGGSMGRLTLLDNTTINPIWTKMAQSKTSTVNISGENTLIKRNVYGGGELGTVRENAAISITNGTINGSVYGGGYGSEDYGNPTTVEVHWGGATAHYTYTPMQWAGCVGGNTNVDIVGGKVKQNVYGGGQMASVGIIDYSVEEDNNGPFTYNNKKYAYKNIVKHADIVDEGTTSEKVYGFGLSWPYEFTYVACNPAGFVGGKTQVNVSGGRIGTGWDDGTGYVFGAGKGKAFERYTEAFCANVRESEVNIKYTTTANPADVGKADCDCITSAVYGGGEDGHVYENSAVNITGGLIGLSVYGGGKGEGTYEGKLRNRTSPYDWNDTPVQLPSWTSGKVYGNSSVTMSGGHVMVNVYGGGNMGSVGKGNYAGGTDDYYTAGYGETLISGSIYGDGKLWEASSNFNPNADITATNKPTTMADYFLSSGKTSVTITAGTVGTKNSVYHTVGGLDQKTPTGMVFGGSRGKSAEDIGRLSPRYAFAPNFFLGYVNNTKVTIGDANGGPTIYSQVFGGGRDGHVRNSSHVIIYNGIIGQAYDEYSTISDDTDRESQRRNCGNVYASGSGMGTWDGMHHGSSSGSVTRNATIDINGGTIYGNVYGGGAMSSVGPPKIAVPDFAAENWSKCTVNINGGTIGVGTDFVEHGYGGSVFGASRGGDLTADESSDEGNLDNYATTLWNEVNIKGGTIAGDVYGGGQAGRVKKDNTVNLTGGTITHDVFGGGMGTSTIAAEVGGNTTVTLNGTATSGDNNTVIYNDNAVVKGSIFGANNVNGTPKGHVTVHVYKTVPAGHGHGYDVTSVFGGGKQADYVPAETDAKQSTEVIIEGCDLTSIQEVYGGGYGAATPGTDVLIKGTKEIDNVFGGGYGYSSTNNHTDPTAPNYNPGANVGFLTGGNQYTLGEGKVLVQLMGGTIHHVYGGSNSYGDIRGGSNVTSVVRGSDDIRPNCCTELNVEEIFGGGKEADMYGGAEIVLGCMPNDWVGAIYAGAESSDVGNDVSLTLTSGKFGRVFGGNKSGGRLNGGIEVNIEENGSCGTPIIIGELYGGGNEAPYSIYGYKDEKDSNDKWIPRLKADYDALTDAQKEAEGIKSGPNHDPVLNIRAFTSIGNIFGGGFGKTAKVVGNPIVNINEVEITHTDTDDDFVGNKYAGETKELIDANGATTNVVLYPHEDGKIGVIGNVFGGGNAAEVIGNTNVNIGTKAEVGFESLRNPDNTLPMKPVVGADIRGNVYGGGNAADVTGETNVVIGKKVE